MDSGVFILKESEKNVSKTLHSNEPMMNIMETPFKGIPETILELPNEDASSLNVSMDVNEDFYSPLKVSMEGNKAGIAHETLYKDCFAQTELHISLGVHKEVQTDNLGLRRKLNLKRVSVDNVSTPPCELRKQIFDLRDELVEAFDFHDNELRVLTEDLLDTKEPEKDDDVESLRRSLADAERIYLDACNEISNLKFVNLELNKKIEDESKNWLTCKHQLEGQISQLNMDIKKKAYEIENLKKDKDDFDFRSQLQSEKFEKRIKDLEAALGDARNDQPSESNPNPQTSNKAISGVEEKISSLQSELEESRKKIQHFEEVKALLKRKEELIAYNENQINSILQKNEELSMDIKKCKEEAAKNKTNYETIVKNLKEEWDNELKVLKSEKDSLNDIIQQLSRENNEINEALKKNKMEFEEELEREKEELERKKEEWEKEKEEWEKEKEELEKGKENLAWEFKEKYEEELQKFELSYKAKFEMLEKLEKEKENLVQERKELVQELEEFKGKYEGELEKIELDYKVRLQTELDLMNMEKQEFLVKEEKEETIVKTEQEKFDFENFVREFTEALISREIVTMEEVESNGNVFYLLADKYLEVVERFAQVKVEEEYKIKMEAMESCLEKFCSQLEASDSTLNASNNSFASFAADVKSSTMVQDVSEMEATIVNDRTLMTHDPLACTPFKTPKSILKSARKPPERTLIREHDEILEEKFKLVEKMESRIEKLEDLASLFESEKERIMEKFAKEKEALRNKLVTKANEVEALRGKLISEISCLNPELENNLASTCTDKILKIFIDTIMEKCKNVEDGLTEAFNKEKFEWEDEKKCFTSAVEGLNAEKKILTEEIEIYEGKINKLLEELEELKEGNTNLFEKKTEIEERLTNQNEELRLLYSRVKEFEAMEHNLVSANDIITSLRSEVLGSESLKSEITDLRNRIQEKDSDLKNVTSEKETILKNLEKSKDFYERIAKENEDLKRRIGESEKMIRDLEEGLTLAKKTQASNEGRVNELVSEIEILKKELSEGNLKTIALEEEIEEEKLKIENLENENVKKSKELEELLENAEEKNKNLQVMMKDLEEKMNELEEAKRAKNSEIENLKILLDEKLGEKNEEFTKFLDLKTKELEEAKNAKNELEEELRNAKENLTVKNEELKKDLQIKTEELIKLKSELEEELRSSRENSKQNEELKNILDVKSEELEKAKALKSELEEELRGAKENSIVYSEKNEQLQKSLHAKTEEFKELKRIKNELEEELRGAKMNLNELAGAESKNETLKKFLDAKTEEFEELKRIKNELEEELRGAKENLTVNSEKNEQLQKSLHAKTEELEELKRIKSELEEELRRNEARLESELEEIKCAKNELEVNLTEKNEELQTVLTKELEEFKRIKSELEEELKTATSTLNSELESQKKILDIKTEELEEFKRLKKEVEEELTGAKANWNSLGIKSEELQKCLDVKSEELQELKRIKIELEEELRGAHTNLNLNSEKNEQLQKILSEEIEELKRIKSGLEEELTRAKINLDSESKVLDNKTEELEQIKRIKNELEEELRGNKTNLDLKAEELKEVQKLRNELEAELREAKSHFNELEETRRTEIENLKMELKTTCQKFSELEESHHALTNKLEEAEIRLKLHFEQTEELTKIKEDLRFSEEKISKLSVRVEELTCDNSQKIVKAIELEKSVEKYENKLKEVEGVKNELAGILSDIRECLNLPGQDFSSKIFTDKINELKKINGEVKDLFCLLSKSDKRSDSIQNSCKSITEEINDLRSVAISLQDELKKSEKKKIDPNLYSRKIGKLEELNTQLTEIINDVIDSVKFPEKLNLNSVRNLKNCKKQILDHFSNLVIHEGDEDSCPKVGKLLQENLKLQKLNSQNLEEINKLKMEIATLQTEFLTGVGSQPSKRTGRKSDLCSRRMDKLEELNTILSELMTEIIAIAKIPNVEKLNVFSVRNITSARKQITDYITNLVEGNTKELNELKSQNEELDEECESYAKEIKTLQQKIRATEREAMEVREALETEICKLKDQKHALEIEFDKAKKEMEGSDVPSGCSSNCQCSALQKELTEVKRTLYSKEQRVLELEDLEVAITSSKSQIKYLEKALNDAKKKCSEEEEKNKKLQSELKDQTQPSGKSRKSSGDQELLEELRMRGAMSGGIVQEIVDKEKVRKLTKDNTLLKDLCRTRYAEIKRLEGEINALKNTAPKNSNQMDSPIRTRCYNTRSRKLPDDPKSPWRFFKDKENQNL